MDVNVAKPKLLILSHVLPFPRRNGQQQRVFNTLQAARERFHTTFLSTTAPQNEDALRSQLLTVCDEAILLPSLYEASRFSKLWHRLWGSLFVLKTGLKFSNYLLGRTEFSPARIAPLLKRHQFDCVLVEYWHATATVPTFRQHQVPCVLDMHNVLWQSHLQKLDADRSLADWWRRRSFDNYKSAEEASWKQYDGVIAITREEHAYVQPRVAPDAQTFYAPMGVDLSDWDYSWQPHNPPRVAFYGGLSSLHNQEAALRCYETIMPRIWQKFPQAELWLVGSNPPPRLLALNEDPRVRVTGFVEKVQNVLCHMTTVLCPWEGTYGFRSRLIEVMALGVPVVATPNAVDGMELQEGEGLLLANDDAGLAEKAISLLSDARWAAEQSRQARRQVEALYGLPNTYGRLTHELADWLENRKGQSAGVRTALASR
jgi:glycosyltransferase involved in cell wall biosynthesis